MTLRVAVLGVMLILFVLALGAAIQTGETWAVAAVVGGLCLALAVERRLYGQAHADRPGAGWSETDEQFVDDASGKLVRVWFNPATGQRRYVEAADTSSD